MSNPGTYHVCVYIALRRSTLKCGDQMERMFVLVFVLLYPLAHSRQTRETKNICYLSHLSL